MSSSTHSQETHPLTSGMDHALDGDVQGPVKQLRASEAAANSAVIQRKKSNETGLPDGLKTGIESLSGMSLDHVRVVYNSSKPAEVQALAYACGDEIHVAPGQEAHLPEEAWHIVQQMQGKVKATTEVNHSPVNDDRKLEEEAQNMGAKAMALQAEPSAEPLQQIHSAAAPVHQLKSKFTNLDNTSEPTPLASLSKVIKPYFEKTDLPEIYLLHGGKQVSPEAYNGTYKRAKSATATLEDGPKAGKRDNSVIGPYGHLGWMERSIMGRPNYGNIFDGGHLIERSLMEGADADIEGNLAPQEGKTFNQNLMRGWEHIPEEYRHFMSFEYRMDLEYTEDTYTRTGKELMEAKVVPDQLGKNLDSSEKTNLEQEVVTFARWIPYKWSGKLDAGEGKVFKDKLFNYGKHQHGLQKTPQDAENSVLNKEEKTGLRRTNSGIIRGAISNLKKTELGTQFKVGGSQTISSEMFAGVPQEKQEVGKRGDLKPQELSSEKMVVSMLKQPFSFKELADELKDYSPKKKLKPKSNKKLGTIDTEAKGKSKSYRFLRDNNFFDVDAGAGFVLSLYNAILDDDKYVLNKVNFLKLASGGIVRNQNKRRLLTMDEKCYDGAIPEEKEEEELDETKEILDEKEVEQIVKVSELEDKKELEEIQMNEEEEEVKPILDELGILDSLDDQVSETPVLNDEEKEEERMQEEDLDDSLSSDSEEILLTKRKKPSPLNSTEEGLNKIVDENEAAEEEIDPFGDHQLKKKVKTEKETFDFPGFDPSKMNFSFTQQE